MYLHLFERMVDNTRTDLINIREPQYRGLFLIQFQLLFIALSNDNFELNYS